MRRARASRTAASSGAAILTLIACVWLPVIAGAQAPSPTPGAVPPPTPVLLPNGQTSPSPFPSTLRTPEGAAVLPELDGRAYILVDLDTGQVLASRAATDRLPVASLTKIMTAVLVLERTRLHDVVEVTPEAAGDGVTAGVSELGLVAGERIRVEDLLYALLLQSANDAAVALAEHVSGSVDAFVADMNTRARRLGLRDTRFFSPNGLDDRGFSTAADLVALTSAAYRRPGFATIVATKLHEIPAPDGAPPRTVQNRNVLLWLYAGAVGVKTGFTTPAGFCIVAVAERDGVRLAAVVLGGVNEVFSEAATLLDHGFTAFERREVITVGEALGTVDVGGRPVEVTSGGSLQALVPVDAEVRRRIVVDGAVGFPPSPGEDIGTVVVSVPGLRIGEVPLEVREVPPPPPPDPGPWWRRAASAVLDGVGAVLDALFG